MRLIFLHLSFAILRLLLFELATSCFIQIDAEQYDFSIVGSILKYIYIYIYILKGATQFVIQTMHITRLEIHEGSALGEISSRLIIMPGRGFWSLFSIGMVVYVSQFMLCVLYNSSSGTCHLQVYWLPFYLQKKI